METLLEVGLVEALAAGIFIGFCLFINSLMRPRPMSERELTKLLQRIAEPERPIPPQLAYRGVPYSSSEMAEPTHPTPSTAAEPTLFTPVPDSTVRLTYRGVTYIKPWFKREP